MPDHIPELDQFLSASEGVPMMPAHEVRRRGNRRRTVRRTGIAAGAMAVLLAAGIGIWQSPLLRSSHDGIAVPATPSPSVTEPSESPTPDPTESPAESASLTGKPTNSPAPTESRSASTEQPTSSPTPRPKPTATETKTVADPTPTETPTTTAPPATNITFEDMPAASLLWPDWAPGEIKDEYTGLGQAGKGMCDPGTIGKPVRVLTREYGAKGDYPTSVWIMLAEYDNAAEATVGFDEIRGAVARCDLLTAERENDVENMDSFDLTGDLPFDVDAIGVDPTKASLTSYGAGIPATDEGYFGQVMVIQMGNRVLWGVDEIIGLDYNCSIQPDPDLEQCPLPGAAQKMAERAKPN